MTHLNARRQFLKNAALGFSSYIFSASAGISAALAHTIAGNSGTLKGKVHKAVQLRMLPKNLSYAERFKIAHAAGFHYVEAYTVTSPAEAEEIRRAAQAANVQIHGVTNGLWTKLPLSSPDATVVRKRLDVVRDSLRQARLYGGNTVLVVPALVTPSVTYREAWARSQRNLKTVTPFAEQQKVIIAVEEVWNKFLLSPLEFASYIDEFKSPWVKAYFDIGNVMPFGYPQDWIRTLGNRIAKIHLKDYDPKTHRFVNLGEGAVDWRAVRQALIDIQYSSIVTVEMPPGPEPYLHDLAGRIDKLLLY